MPDHQRSGGDPRRLRGRRGHRADHLGGRHDARQIAQRGFGLDQGGVERIGLVVEPLHQRRGGVVEHTRSAEPAHDEAVGREHVLRAGQRLRAVLHEPGQLRGTEEGIRAVARLRHDLGDALGLVVGPAVEPGERRVRRIPRLVDRHQRRSLRGHGDRGDLPPVHHPAGDRAHGLPPRVRVLLRSDPLRSGRVALRGVGHQRAAAVGGDHFDGARTDIDAEE
jgi:hypothetical protein